MDGDDGVKGWMLLVIWLGIVVIGTFLLMILLVLKDILEALTQAGVG